MSDSRKEIFRNLDANGFCVIPGKISASEVRAAVQKLKSNFSIKNDHPSLGETPSAVRSNFQKINLGGVAERYNNYPRFFRTFYNPVWEPDIYGMRNIFLKMIQFRNELMDLPKEYAAGLPEPTGMWSACRIHQYPIGGGFFCSHRDNTLLDVAREKRIDFIQILLVMSQKNIDYERGGAFVDFNDRRHPIEENLELGDLVIYDGNSVHGVEEIDPHRNLDLSQVNGRLAAFVSLYKVME